MLRGIRRCDAGTGRWMMGGLCAIWGESLYDEGGRLGIEVESVNPRWGLIGKCHSRVILY